MNLSLWAVRHRALVGFLIVLLFAAGLFSYNRLGRAEDPSFTMKVMVVSAIWPGATAAETQAQVAERIERKLQDLPHLDKLDTFSRPGAVFTLLALRDDTPPAEVPSLFYQVRKKLDDLRPELPAGVQIAANDEYADVYGAVFALTGADNAELVRQAEQIRDRLLLVPGAEKIAILGERPRAIHVAFSHARLASLGVTVPSIAEALARQNAVAAAGIVETGNTRVPLRVDGALDGLAAVADTPITPSQVHAGGRSLRLGDLATLSRGYADPPSYLIRHDGQGAVIVAVSMAKGTNGLDFGAALRTEANQVRADLPAGIEMTQIADQSQAIEEAVSEFLLKFCVALAVVLAVSFASLGRCRCR